MARLRRLGYHVSDCGYCKKKDSSASYYVSSRELSPSQYQRLMDRGWRRSGRILYLPDAVRSCCPHYTIRLPCEQYSPTKDQRQALNKWNRFVLGEDYVREHTKKYPLTREEKQRAREHHNFIKTLHESELGNLKPNLTPAHQFVVTIEEDNYTDEKFKLFKTYQTHVHHDDEDEVDEGSFTRFLCDSPVTRETSEERRFGSYHQCYRLDGKLFAMGVIDLLPNGVSAVYFLYDPELEKYSLGKLSAMREAALAGEHGYNNYYMGYYIHDCAKMRYKATFRPQHVLDLESLGWDKLDDEMMALMSKQKYVSMSKVRAKKRQASTEGTGNGVADAEGDHEMKDDQNGDHDHDTVGEDIASEYAFQNPQDADNSGQSLLVIGMPGILSTQKVVQSIDLGSMTVITSDGMSCRMMDLMGWSQGSVTDLGSIKGIAAEYAACLGPELVQELHMDFSRGF